MHLSAAARHLNLVTLLFAYHDLVARGSDRKKLNIAVFQALEPGGDYVIADHGPAPGSGSSAPQRLNGIDEGIARAEVEAAGFTFVESAELHSGSAQPDAGASAGARVSETPLRCEMALRKDSVRAMRSVGRGRRPLKSIAFAAAAGLFAACAPPRAAQDPADLQPTPIYRFEGDVQLRNGATLHYLAILVPDPAAAGSYLGTIDIPKQALSGAALRAVTLELGERVEFALNADGQPRWIGAYDTDGSLVCEFRQADIRLRCSMREVNDVSPGMPQPPHREQTPLPPFPYASEDVQYVNPAAHVLLSATADPARRGRSASSADRGRRSRDAGPRRFVLGSSAMARARRSPGARGTAVLRTDPHRADGRTSSTSGIDGVALESDVESGLALLRSSPEVDARRLGLLAHGHGGSVAASLSNQPGAARICR
jgi:hypothetical protein